MAVATKSKGPASDAIMTPDKMKPILATSKQEPVSAAIGQTTDGEGLLLLHKKAKPKQVLSMLKAEAGKAKLQLNNASMRFGRAEVDLDYDPAMVRFFVNKETPGVMRVKLIEVVKRVPYQKVEINVDPSLVEESEDEAEGHEPNASASAAPGTSPPPVPDPAPAVAAAPPTAPTPTAPVPDAAMLTAQLRVLLGQIPSVAGADAAPRAELVQLASDANGEIKASNLDAAAAAIVRLRDALGGAGAAAGAAAPDGHTLAAAPDGHALAAELATLLHRIPQAADTDAAFKGRLLKLAGDANTNLKAHNLSLASDAIAQLRDALDGSGGGTAGSAPDDGQATRRWQDARQAWQSANDNVNEQINALRAAVLDRAKTEPDYAETLLEIADKGLNALTENHRVILMASLMDIGDGAPDALRTHGPKALGLVTDFESFIAGSEKIAVCDANPFGIPVSIRATLVPALRTLADALKEAA